GTAPGLDGIKVVAPDTVHIELTQAWTELPTALASPSLAIVPKPGPGPGAAGASGGGDVLPGTGPFLVVSHGADTLLLERSPGSPASGGAPERIVVRFFDSVADSYAAFLAGDLDWSRVPGDQATAAADRFGQSFAKSGGDDLLFGFNFTNPKF